MTDPLAPLRERFRARIRADRAELETLKQGNTRCEELRRLVHNLAGAAGTFGFGELSQAAIEIDDQMASGLAADPASLERLTERLDEAIHPEA